MADEHKCPHCLYDWSKGETNLLWPACPVCLTEVERCLRAYHGPGVDEDRFWQLVSDFGNELKYGKDLPGWRCPAHWRAAKQLLAEQRAHDAAKVAGLVEAMESIAGRGYAGASFVANEALRAYRGQEA